MMGAIIGDIAGSRYEFSPVKDKDFSLFPEGCEVTDDSVMTVAVAEVLLDLKGDESDDEIKERLAGNMKKWGSKYPDAGYGGRFAEWLQSDSIEPYNSYGNGSAMRVAAVGWLYDDLETTRHMARLTAEVTHNHPEGIKGAESVAAAMYMGRTGSTKEEIKEYVEKEFGYDLSRPYDEVRENCTFNETCQVSVPEAFIAFLEGNTYTDAVGNAIYLGGDADTQACIAGAIAEAFYDDNEDEEIRIPFDIWLAGFHYLPKDMEKVVNRFYNRVRPWLDEDKIDEEEADESDSVLLN